MTTVTVPSLKMFADGTKLRTAARSINGLLEFARASAITERTEYVVLFDSTNKQYWLSLKEFLDESQGTLTDSSRTNLAASLEALAEKNSTDNTGTSTTSNTSSTSDNSMVPLTRTGGLLGIPRDLPAGIEIVQINSPRSTSKSSDVEYVTFYPDSKAEDFEVYLQSASEKTFLISVSESTGRTGIRELTSEEIEQLGLVANTTK
jgi:Tfp pilus assembly protein FimT